MSDEEESDESYIIHRTDGYWYRNAFRVLSKFVNKLKIDIFFLQRDLPFDIQTLMLTMAEKDQDKYIPMTEQLRLLREYNTFINIELRAQLVKLGIQYDEQDIYNNVVNYAKSTGLNLSDEKILLKDVLPWLGTTDWNSNSGGRSKQLLTIKNKIKKLLKGGNVNKKNLVKFKDDEN